MPTAETAAGLDDGLHAETGAMGPGRTRRRPRCRCRSSGRQAACDDPRTRSPLADADVRRVREAVEERGEVVVDERYEELVHVDERQPVDRRAEEAEGVRIRIDLATRERPVDERQEAVVAMALDDLREVVIAPVVIEEDVVDAERDVIAEPLLQVRRLVADDDDDPEAQPRRCDERALAQDIARCRPLRLAGRASRSRLAVVPADRAGDASCPLPVRSRERERRPRSSTATLPPALARPP